MHIGSLCMCLRYDRTSSAVCGENTNRGHLVPIWSDDLVSRGFSYFDIPRFYVYGWECSITNRFRSGYSSAVDSYFC